MFDSRCHAHRRDGLSDGGIGVFCQENVLCAAGCQGFSELLGSNHDPFFA